MRKCLFMMLFAVVSIAAWAQTQVNIIYNSGATVSYSVAASGVVAFTDESHIIVKESASSTGVTIAVDDIRKITFGSALSVAEAAQPAAFRIYPNPARETITIATSGRHTASFYSLDGTLLLQSEVEGAAVVNIASLPVGIYYVTVDGKTKKFIKMQ